MGYWGMNVAAIGQLSRELERSASDVDAATRAADAIVDRLQYCWVGQDADRFIGEWFQFSQSTLKRVPSGLFELSQRARHEMARQQYISTH